MKIEDLIHCSADELEKMTDQELLAHFEKYLPTTRPELQPNKEQRLKAQVAQVNPALVRAAELLKGKGVNIDLGLLKGLKKK